MYRLARLARDAGEDCLVTLAQRVADRYYSLARRAAGVGDGREAWGKNHEPPFVDILNNLARQQALGAPTSRSRCDLGRVAAAVVDAAGTNGRFSPSLAPAPCVLEPPLAELAVHNLLDNAVAHGTADVPIAVTTGSGRGGSWLRVESGGAAVSPDDARRITEPFVRLGTARTGSARSAGLGLAIVAAIVDNARGTLRLEPREGGGLVATVVIPRGAGDPA